MRVWLVAALFVACGIASAQTLGEAAHMAHRAREGSATPPEKRVFLSDWYAAAEARTNMSAPVVGMPMTGTMERTVPYTNSSKTDERRMYHGHYMFWRDPVGRVRIDTIGAYHPEIPESDMQQEPTLVLVLDPVSRCIFTWTVGYLVAPRAEVSCLTKDKTFLPLDAWDAQNQAEIAYQSTHPDAKFVNESTGTKKMFGVVEGVEYERFEIRKNGNQLEGRSYWGQRWYAPQIKDLVMSTVPDRHARYPSEHTDFEAEITALGEPDGGLFYPPAGWRISVAKVGWH